MRQLNKKTQQGMSMIGLLFMASFFAFLIYVGIKLGPIYNEYFDVVKAMKQTAAEPGIAQKTPSYIRNALSKRMWASYVDEKHIKAKNIKIIRSRGKQLHVKYEIRQPFMYNVDIVVSFDKKVPLSK